MEHTLTHIELGQRMIQFSFYSWRCGRIFIFYLSQRVLSVWNETNQMTNKEHSNHKILPKSLISAFDGVLVFVVGTVFFVVAVRLPFVSRICNGIRTERCGVWSFITLAISNTTKNKNHTNSVFFTIRFICFILLLFAANLCSFSWPLQ